MEGGGEGLELDGGEPSETALTASTMVGAFDPGDDGEAHWSRVSHRRRSETFFWSSEKNDSMAALSAHVATRPIDPSRPARLRAATKAFDRNCDPRSECTTVPEGPRRPTALRRALTARSAVIRSLIE